MNDTIRSTIAGVAVLLGLQGVARGADLWDVYQIALTQDAAYGAAGYEYQSARLTLPLARSAFLPSVSVRGTAERVRGADADAGNNSNTEHRSSLNADLRVFDLESLRAYGQAKLRVSGAAIRFEDARSDLILRVAERYFGLLAATDDREVVRRRQTSIQRQMDLASQRLEVGLGTRTDLFDAQARFQQTVADVIEAGNRIDNAVQALKQITGAALAARALAPLNRDAPLAPPDPQSLDAWIGRALENNRALKAEDLNLKVAAEEIKKQRASRWPRIDLGVRRDWRESDNGFSNGQGGDGGNNAQNQNNGFSQETDSSTVEATLNWQLYRGGAIHLQTKDAGFRFNAAERAREELKRQVESDTTSAYLAVVSGISQVKALSEAVRAGESALRAKEEGFRAGLTTNLDVLDAQRDLARSRSDHLGARYDFILSVLRLERAAGDLDEADVKRINGWLSGGS